MAVVCVLVALLVAFQVFGCEYDERYYDEINVNRDHNNEDDIVIEKYDQIFLQVLAPKQKGTLLAGAVLEVYNTIIIFGIFINHLPYQYYSHSRCNYIHQHLCRLWSTSCSHLF